jgi:hypothetical protein
LNTTRKAVLAAAIVGASLAGGAMGSALIGAAGAQTTPTTQAPAASTTATPTYNTDPAHEAGESAQRQADEVARDAQAGSSTTPTTGG